MITDAAAANSSPVSKQAVEGRIDVQTSPPIRSHRSDERRVSPCPAQAIVDERSLGRSDLQGLAPVLSESESPEVD